MMLRFNVWHNSITAYKQLNYDLCPFLIFLNTLIRMSNKISSKRKQVIKKGFKTWACNTKIQFVKTYKTKSTNISLKQGFNKGICIFLYMKTHIQLDFYIYIYIYIFEIIYMYYKNLIVISLHGVRRNNIK